MSDPSFAKSEEKLEALCAMDTAREGSLMHFFRLGDNDAEESSTQTWIEPRPLTYALTSVPAAADASCR